MRLLHQTLTRLVRQEVDIGGHLGRLGSLVRYAKGKREEDGCDLLYWRVPRRQPEVACGLLPSTLPMWMWRSTGSWALFTLPPKNPGLYAEIPFRHWMRVGVHVDSPESIQNEHFRMTRVLASGKETGWVVACTMIFLDRNHHLSPPFISA